MPRYVAGARTSAGSTALPIISLYAAAAARGRLREVGLFNTTTTAVEVTLVRLTTTGTQGAALTRGKYDPDAVAASCDPRNTHTANPTLGNNLGYRGVIGAAVGAGIIWTFGDQGLMIPTGTANGIGVIVANGVGQILQSYLVWDES